MEPPIMHFWYIGNKFHQKGRNGLNCAKFRREMNLQICLLT